MDTFLGQIKIDGEWVDYARGSERESRRWWAQDPTERRVVDWIDKDHVIFSHGRK